MTSGGKAPGPQPLKECLVKIKGILDGKQEGSKLSTLEVHDIVCYIAEQIARVAKSKKLNWSDLWASVTQP